MERNGEALRTCGAVTLIHYKKNNAVIGYINEHKSFIKNECNEMHTFYVYVN